MKRRELLALPAAAFAQTARHEIHPVGIVITSNDTRLEGKNDLRGAGMSALATVSVRPFTNVRWELLRAGKSLSDAILWQRGIDAAIRFPREPGPVTLRAIAGSATFEMPMEVRAITESKWPAPTQPTAKNPGERLQRAMDLLARGKRARILFYGQSITKQDWWWRVVEDLQRRYPRAQIEYDNRAIGGYSSPFLVRTMERDVLTFDPDLVIFHVYGAQAEYERIIRWIRSNTHADVAIQNDHVNTYPENDAQKQRDRQSFEFLPKLCDELGCELIDIRRPWRQYLQTHNLRHQDLQKDGVHLNERGNWLMAELTKPSLTRVRGAKPVPLAGHAHRYDATGRGRHAVYVDGKRPSEFSELYSHTRPTLTWDADWPCLNRVEWEAQPMIEDWRVRVVEAKPDLASFRFAIDGSVTGPDGEGISTEKFVSKSGRVMIHPQDWAMKRSFSLRKKPMPVNWEVWWSVLPLAHDEVELSNELVTVVNGLPLGEHKVELRPLAKGARVKELRAYRSGLSSTFNTPR